MRLSFLFLFIFICLLSASLVAQDAMTIYKSAIAKTQEADYVSSNAQFEKAAAMFASDGNWEKYVGCYNGMELCPHG